MEAGAPPLVPVSTSPVVLALPAARRADDVAPRVARAEAILARIAEGHDVPVNDAAWAQAFVEMPAFKAFKSNQSHQGSLTA